MDFDTFLSKHYIAWIVDFCSVSLSSVGTSRCGKQVKCLDIASLNGA